jgi:hypothetical protein
MLIESFALDSHVLELGVSRLEPGRQAQEVLNWSSSQCRLHRVVLIIVIRDRYLLRNESRKKMHSDSYEDTWSTQDRRDTSFTVAPPILVYEASPIYVTERSPRYQQP